MEPRSSTRLTATYRTRSRTPPPCVLNTPQTFYDYPRSSVERRDRTPPRWRPDTPLDTRTFYRRRREARTWFDKTANPPRIPRTRPRTPDRRHFFRSRNRSPIVHSTSSRNRSPARVSSVGQSSRASKDDERSRITTPRTHLGVRRPNRRIDRTRAIAPPVRRRPSFHPLARRLVESSARRDV